MLRPRRRSRTIMPWTTFQIVPPQIGPHRANPRETLGHLLDGLFLVRPRQAPPKTPLGPKPVFNWSCVLRGGGPRPGVVRFFRWY